MNAMPMPHARIAFAWALALAAGAFLAGCSSKQDAPEDTGQAAQPQVFWDYESKPIPDKFLHLKAVGNCGGSPCSDDSGLVNQAGVDFARDHYYANIGEGNLKTFSGWKQHYGFPPRKPGQSLDAYRAANNVVVYYNLTELGLGREIGCNKSGSGDIACYVTNYGDQFDTMYDPSDPDSAAGLQDAIGGGRVKNTVVISSVASRPANKRVQFSAFGADGKRLNKAQLDNMGARDIPQICMSCHGGNWDATAGVATNARFLPLITSTVKFSDYSPYTQGEQENAIKAINELAWQARAESLTTRQQQMLQRLYNVSGETLSFRNDSSQDWANAPPLGWPNPDQKQLYNFVALRYCDTCHAAMGDAMSTNLDSFNAYADAIWNFSGGFMGWTPTGYHTWNSGSWATSKSALMMPHAQPANSRFWGYRPQGGTDGLWTAYNHWGTPAEYLYWFLGLWTGGTPPSSIPGSLQATNNTICGQNASMLNNTSSDAKVGTNSGRNFTGTFQCTDGCEWGSGSSLVLCPGSEGNNLVSWSSVRQECTANFGFGSCVSCGRVGQPACTRIGAGCETTTNPNCTNLPACHEGVLWNGMCTMTNFARNQAATQSSTYSTAVATRAVDGNTNGAYSAGSVSHTQSQAGAWWTVPLGGTRTIKRIDIYNRTDSCCVTRLSDFKVFLWTGSAWRVAGATSHSNDSGVTPWETGAVGDFTGLTPPSTSVTAIELPKPETASQVKIQLNGTNYLHMAEVAVWGW